MRVVVVVGGIFSGVGKGIAAASIGKILREYGFSVTAVKIDPYINFDAGTLRPTEHGEVWVTDDGGEIDQDLGNYERFLGVPIPASHNITTGQVYWKVIQDERQGKYLGQTVQFIPHIPNEIKSRIKAASQGYDFVIVEIGGVAGDYENLPFLFASKSLEIELGKQNIAYVLITYLPIPPNIGEMKTKPTQHAIRLLSESGVSPDFIIARATQHIDAVRKHKIETYANIDSSRIISAPDVQTVYEVPLNFEADKLGEKLLSHFGLQPRIIPDWTGWAKAINRIKSPSRRIRIGMIGKYVTSGDFQLHDSYISINQALEHAGAELDAGADISWVDAESLESMSEDELASALSRFQGIVIPGGFGTSGIEGKIRAIKYCRETRTPFLGLCLGMQLAVVEFARAVGLNEANTTEVRPDTPHPVIDVMPGQQQVLQRSQYGATMRLGAYAANLLPGSMVYMAYRNTGRLERDQAQLASLKADKKQSFRLGTIEAEGDVIFERHRHRFEVNPKYAEKLSDAGLLFSGWHTRADGTRLMEFLELQDHPCFLATQSHPEFKSRLGDPAPLFLAFLKACAGQ